jgi:hypothetical protein
MSLRSISINLDSMRFSDLFFNFEHPEYDAALNQEFERMTAGSGKVTQLYPSDDDLTESLLKDAVEFTGTLGFSGPEQMEISAELVADFLRRV